MFGFFKRGKPDAVTAAKNLETGFISNKTFTSQIFNSLATSGADVKIQAERFEYLFSLYNLQMLDYLLHCSQEKMFNIEQARSFVSERLRIQLNNDRLLGSVFLHKLQHYLSNNSNDPFDAFKLSALLADAVTEKKNDMIAIAACAPLTMMIISLFQEELSATRAG